MKSFLNTILVYCVGVSLCYLQSCYDPNSNVDCNDTETITQNISAGDLSKVPYTGFDTLYFLNKQGDTCVVRGTGKQYSYETEYLQGNPACPPSQKYNYQVYRINFIALRGNLEFTIYQNGEVGLIKIEKSNYDTYFYSTASIIGVKYNNRPYYIDSLILNGSPYGRITVFSSNVAGEVGVNDTSYKLFYNQPYGILYMKSSKQNEEFSIIPKI